MKKKIFQRWKRVEYKGEKFKYWSSQIEGEGDKTLSIREKKSQKKKN